MAREEATGGGPDRDLMILIGLEVILMICSEWPEIKLDEYKGVWVGALVEEGEINEASLQLIGAAKELADKLGTYIGVALVGYKIKELAEELIYYGADKVFVVDDEKLAIYYPSTYGMAIRKLAEKYKPEVLLIPATLKGREMAPYIANMFRTGITADLTSMDIDPKSKEVVLIRPPFGGYMLAHIVTKTRRPVMGSVRPNIFSTPQRDEKRKGEIVKEEVDVPEPKGIRLVGRIPIKKKEEIPIEKAEIIVSGGKGLGSEDGFKLLKELADLLGGVIAGSRKVVDAGWIDHNHQVGQTGKAVKPNVYFAVAISGAAQHVFGIREARRVIAINIDPNAPIFESADYGIVGNYKEVIPAIIEVIKEMKQKRKTGS